MGQFIVVVLAFYVPSCIYSLLFAFWKESGYKNVLGSGIPLTNKVLWPAVVQRASVLPLKKHTQVLFPFALLSIVVLKEMFHFTVFAEYSAMG